MSMMQWSVCVILGAVILFIVGVLVLEELVYFTMLCSAQWRLFVAQEPHWKEIVASLSWNPLGVLAILKMWDTAPTCFLAVEVVIAWQGRVHVDPLLCKCVSALAASVLAGSLHWSAVTVCVAAFLRPCYPKKEAAGSSAQSSSSKVHSGGVLDSARWRAAPTLGDGACGLHSVWGVWAGTHAHREFCCDYARERLLASTPEPVEEILLSTTAGLFEEMQVEQTQDLTAYAVAQERGEAATAQAERGSAVIWDFLEDATRAGIQDHAMRKMTEEDDLRAREREMLTAVGQRGTLAGIRPLLRRLRAAQVAV